MALDVREENDYPAFYIVIVETNYINTIKLEATDDCELCIVQVFTTKVWGGNDIVVSSARVFI